MEIQEDDINELHKRFPFLSSNKNQALNTNSEPWFTRFKCVEDISQISRIHCSLLVRYVQKIKVKQYVFQIDFSCNIYDYNMVHINGERKIYPFRLYIISYCILETVEVISKKQKRPLLTAVYP